MTILSRQCEDMVLGLRLTDGLYEEANKTYYMNWSKDNQLKSNIAYILHQADLMATKIEYNNRQLGDEYPYNTEFGDGKTKEEMVKIDLDNRDREEKINTKREEQSKRANQAFKDLFGE